MNTNVGLWKKRNRRSRLSGLGIVFISMIVMIVLLMILLLNSHMDYRTATQKLEQQDVLISELSNEISELKEMYASPIEPSVQSDKLPEPEPFVKEEVVYAIPTYDNVDSFNLLSESDYTSEEIDAVLSSTGLSGLGCDYRKAEDETGVNAIFLISVSALESGWGKSELAIKKNNIFGWCAYDDSIQLATAFATKSESILNVANALHKNYFTEGGSCFNGYTVSDVGIRYATAEHWSNAVEKIMVRLYTKLENNRVTDVVD